MTALRPKPVDAFELARTSRKLWMMGLEAQAVMTMRMMGMAGLWNVDSREDARMMLEKPEALGRSAMAGMLAAVSGERPEKIMRAGLGPLRAKTKSNARRLARRGPKLET